MSFEITTAFVEQFEGNIDLLSQQMDSRFAGAVRDENQTGETAFFEQVGPTDVEEATSRHDDTPRMDTPHARRKVVLRTFRWASAPRPCPLVGRWKRTAAWPPKMFRQKRSIPSRVSPKRPVSAP